MSETTAHTTNNGFEISHPRELLSPMEFKQMIGGEYGLEGNNPQERLNELKKMPMESIAFMMSDINRRTQGSDETLVTQKTMKIGEKTTVAPEYRYDLFKSLIDKIKSTDDSINPSRVGDSLALGTVLLHPFEDGNGRTARLLGLVFNDDYDASDYEDSFNALSESRDVARKRGGMVIYGYIPRLGEGVDQSDPVEVDSYFDKLLTEQDTNLYVGPYGQAPLKVQPAEAVPTVS